jgi:hypothetical protein
LCGSWEIDKSHITFLSGQATFYNLARRVMSLAPRAIPNISAMPQYRNFTGEKPTMKNAQRLYKLNGHRSWMPRGHDQIRATAVVEDYLEQHLQANLQDIQNHLDQYGLGHLADVEVETAMWLAASPQNVITEVH